jgi:hypothetical protein
LIVEEDVMLRMITVSLLAASLALVACADDPKPPWQRLLTGDDAKKAKELEKHSAELEAADNYAEAIRVGEELLALRTVRQGADHWQTKDQRSDVEAMKKVAALPKEQRAGWRKAMAAAEESLRLAQRGDDANALRLWRERLALCRQVLGENDPKTLEGYNNVATFLREQGKCAEALASHQKTLDLYRSTLGEDHPETATSCENLAGDFQELGKYVQAEPLFQDSLSIRRRVLGENDANTAQSYNNVAFNLQSQGKYAQAGPLLQKALTIYRKVLGEDQSKTAISYSNAANNLNFQGKYAEAEPLYQKALGIFRTVFGEDHPFTARSYSNLAHDLQKQGKEAQAEALYVKTLEIRRKVLGEQHPDTAKSYGDVAQILESQGKHGDAEPLLQKALDIKLKTLGKGHQNTAVSYSYIAANLARQGKNVAAEPLYEKALDIMRTALGENHEKTAISYNNVAANLSAQGKYSAAEPLYRKGLDISRKALGEDHPEAVASYQNVATNLQAQRNYAGALALLEKCARGYEAVRLDTATAGLERAAYGAKHSPYAFLAAARSRAGRSVDAWEALEADLARGLLDEIAQRRGIGLTAAELSERNTLRAQQTALDPLILDLVRRKARTAAEGEELGQLTEHRRQLEKSLSELSVKVSSRELASFARFQAALPADAAWIAWVDVSDLFGGVQEHWSCVVLPKGDPRWEQLPGSAPDGKWTKQDTDLAAEFRAAVLRSAPAGEIEALTQRLHAQRLPPLSKHLTGIKRLFVAPVGLMAGVPVETLTDQYTVSYTPSGTYFARRKDRAQPGSKRLLAVGDPLFPPSKDLPRPTELPPGGLLITQVVPDGNAANARLQASDVLVAYAGENLSSVEQLGKLVAAQAGAKSVVVKVWREGQAKLAERELAPGRLGVAFAKEPAREAIAARRQTDQMLAMATRGDDFAELPGTEVEIARLAGLFDQSQVTSLTRADASEQRLDVLRKSDELKQFRYLHFATHGKANNVRSFDSALLLTRPERVPEPRVGEPWLDGRLTAAEVLEYWKLDAELVTLSACESGLGREGGGDGLLGFAQAFLLAGSRAVCLTLWEVDDTATALLMDRFYRNLLGKREDGAKPMGKAAALHEAKQWLRTLPADAALERLGTLTKGVVRGERPAREVMHAVPKPPDAGPEYKPYAHPRYWAAFVLIGDPD